MIQSVDSTSYERMAARYEQDRGGGGRARVIADALHHWLNPGSAVVDIGSGTGIIAGALIDHGLEVIGADISMGMISRAVARLPGAVALADGQALPFRSGSMSAATFVWSLHHIGDPSSALREARRTVSSGGRVIVVSATPEPSPDEVQTLFRRLDVLTPPRAPDWITRAAVAAQMKLVASTHIEIDVERSPLDLAQQIEERLYSPLWYLDAERWNTVVVPVMESLRNLEDPSRKRRVTLRSPLFVFEA
jgi:ubiquinone/menaquinone biosynthesis C-methylase UbiE